MIELCFAWFGLVGLGLGWLGGLGKGWVKGVGLVGLGLVWWGLGVVGCLGWLVLFVRFCLVGWVGRD